MKFLLIFCLFACGLLVSQAQVTPPETMDIGAEKLRIREQRAIHEANFSTAYAACFERFMVFDCQQDAKRARRKAMDELHRQDVFVNGLERQANAATTLQRIDQKMSPEHQVQRKKDQNQALQETEARRLRNIDKLAVSAPSNAASNLGSIARKAPEPVKLSDLSNHEQRYVEKQKEAMQHKQDKVKSLIGREGNSPKSLPIPAVD